MAARFVRTPSGAGFTADITPADVVDRCPGCRVTYREGDMYCSHLQARYGHQVALLADRYQPTMTCTASPGAGQLAAVFLPPPAAAVPA